jgi:hypothetical protein
LSDHHEYIECKLLSLKKYTTHLDAVIAWVMETKTRINISKELPDKEKKKVIDNIMVRKMSHIKLKAFTATELIKFFLGNKQCCLWIKALLSTTNTACCLRRIY